MVHDLASGNDTCYLRAADADVPSENLQVCVTALAPYRLRRTGGKVWMLAVLLQQDRLLQLSQAWATQSVVSIVGHKNRSCSI
jgi:hypothetical protein